MASSIPFLLGVFFGGTAGSLWLERNDDTALCVKRRWQSRALRHVEMHCDYVDLRFADDVAMQARSLEVIDNTWTRGPDDQCTLHNCHSDNQALAALIASLTIDPPRLS